jgi:hypothetical protein
MVSKKSFATLAQDLRVLRGWMQDAEALRPSW